MDTDELIRRQKEIIKKLGAKLEGSGGELRINQKQRKRLNEELREINKKLKTSPDYQRKPLRSRAVQKKRKKKKPDKKTPSRSPVLQEYYENRVRELVERHCELQARLETVRGRSSKQLLREELASTEALIQEYEPYLKGYKLIRAKKKSKGSGLWIHIWQGGAPQ